MVPTMKNQQPPFLYDSHQQHRRSWHLSRLPFRGTKLSLLGRILIQQTMGFPLYAIADIWRHISSRHFRSSALTKQQRSACWRSWCYCGQDCWCLGIIDPPAAIKKQHSNKNTIRKSEHIQGTNGWIICDRNFPTSQVAGRISSTSSTWNCPNIRDSVDSQRRNC